VRGWGDILSQGHSSRSIRPAQSSHPQTNAASTGTSGVLKRLALPHPLTAAIPEEIPSVKIRRPGSVLLNVTRSVAPGSRRRLRFHADVLRIGRPCSSRKFCYRYWHVQDHLGRPCCSDSARDQTKQGSPASRYVQAGSIRPSIGARLSAFNPRHMTGGRRIPLARPSR